MSVTIWTIIGVMAVSYGFVFKILPVAEGWK